MATAQSIIKRCGGPRQVAEWLKLDRSTVQRWIGDGQVPAKRWAPLIMAAKLNGVDIAPEELIPAAAHEAARIGSSKPRRQKSAA